MFSIPLFRNVPEPPAAGPQHGSLAVVAAFSRLAQTFREIRRYRHAFLLFIAMLLYQDGIQTIIRMASVYGAEVGIDQNAQIAAFVMVQFVGIPFAFLFGALGTRIGTKRCIFIAIGVYIAGDDPRLLHDQRDALLRARVPGRHGAGRRAGAQPRAVRAADSARIGRRNSLASSRSPSGSPPCSVRRCSRSA